MSAETLKLSSRQPVQWMIRLLCVLGLGVSGYLAWTYLINVEPYCGTAQSCAQVQNSDYANLAGIPIPLIGVFGYLLLLVLSLLRGRVNEDVEFYLPVLSFGAALIGVLFSVYLTYLEAFEIKAWCYWCVASAVIMIAIWFLTIADLRRTWSE